MKTTKLTGRFERALTLAHKLHRSQIRKGTGIPYISHLISVCALVLEDGGSEDEAIAALLHDAVEDQGGLPTLKKIRLAFGPRVAKMVAGCSDAFEIPKPPWKERKQAYLNRLAMASPSVQRVIAADKLHNLRCTLMGLQDQGPSVWDRFSANRGDQFWYYRKALEILKNGGATRHTRDLAETIDRLAKLSANQNPSKGDTP